MLKTVSDETINAPSKPSQEDLDKMEALYGKAQLASKVKKMACTSVDFSPNGTHLAGVCYDDTLSLWDLDPAWLSREPILQEKKARLSTKSGKLTDWFPSTTGPQRAVSERPKQLLDHPNTLIHNNQTGKWVTLFRATWHQNQQLEPHFSIGGMTRHAEIYGKDGRLMASLFDPNWITAIPAVIAMHPIAPARIATGNGSGRCAFWAPPSDVS